MTFSVQKLDFEFRFLTQLSSRVDLLASTQVNEQPGNAHEQVVLSTCEIYPVSKVKHSPPSFDTLLMIDTAMFPASAKLSVFLQLN